MSSTGASSHLAGEPDVRVRHHIGKPSGTSTVNSRHRPKRPSVNDIKLDSQSSQQLMIRPAKDTISSENIAAGSRKSDEPRRRRTFTASSALSENSNALGLTLSTPVSTAPAQDEYRTSSPPLLQNKIAHALPPVPPHTPPSRENQRPPSPLSPLTPLPEDTPLPTPPDALEPLDGSSPLTELTESLPSTPRPKDIIDLTSPSPPPSPSVSLCNARLSTLRICPLPRAPSPQPPLSPPPELDEPWYGHPTRYIILSHTGRALTRTLSTQSQYKLCGTCHLAFSSIQELEYHEEVHDLPEDEIVMCDCRCMFDASLRRGPTSFARHRAMCEIALHKVSEYQLIEWELPRVLTPPPSP
ncbi:hypothetical protein EXIGLDRAFT_760904 [Exidia glandulosa HHB12029]|uniref:C2H2-type domain-containing protein n=1 Tax=Exidia glandulosa HHB12029 TaxID=1314781 RepID=A0A165NYT6_EXIGL|nr:hypothetical protein EXIGLDRAFT_760904 [Exidia glandulosa HHB12029]